MPESTLPLRSAGHPVREFNVTVVAGVDRGARAASDAEPIHVGTADTNTLVLTDPAVSRFHVTFARDGERVRVIDHGSTNGTFVGPARLDAGTASVAPGTTVRVGQSELLVGEGEVQLVDRGPDRFSALAGRAPSMRRLFARAQQVAASDASVLIQGESGTGKELLARGLHDGSPRAEAPFVTVDCGALAANLVASELFGHERGAFTGADRQHVGAFERASGGTVFLDEVGELASEMQVALLGVLERRRFRRVGGTSEVQIDVRIVSATHRDLLSAVNAGTFRLDLFYRLAVVRLEIPPLREHPSDIPLLVELFLRDRGRENDLGVLFPEARLAELGRHAWPGNVRELRNVVDGTLALGRSPALDELARTAGGGDVVGGVLTLPYRHAKQALVDDFERRYVGALLGRSGGNVRAAARDAQMDRKYLTELIRRHRLG